MYQNNFTGTSVAANADDFRHASTNFPENIGAEWLSPTHRYKLLISALGLISKLAHQNSLLHELILGSRLATDVIMALIF